MTLLDPFDRVRIGAVLDDLRQAETTADNEFSAGVLGYSQSEYDTPSNAAWHIEVAFLKLLTAVEVLGLSELKRLVVDDIKSAKSKTDGFADSERGPDEPYSVWMGRYRQYIKAIETIGGAELERSVTKDLTEILRATEYPITDPRLFGGVPNSEDDVHRRIEGVLRCVFPDLKHKPQLTKPIKNFEPDTGLPGIQTLIEYKFLGKSGDVSSVADQVLADTRGYHSRDWTTFVYVIYETNRFRPEREWLQFLRECGVSTSTSLIVLSGEPAPKKKSKGSPHPNRGTNA